MSDSHQGGTTPLDFLPDPFYITFVPERQTDASLRSDRWHIL